MINDQFFLSQVFSILVAVQKNNLFEPVWYDKRIHDTMTDKVVVTLNNNKSNEKLTRVQFWLADGSMKQQKKKEARHRRKI